MKSREALRILAEVSEPQWGLVTSAQARARGVTHMNLTRLADSGDLVRLAHGVYRDAGAPGGRHEELRAAWLATEPAELAHERLRRQPVSAVVSGESAARLHDIGDLRGMRSEFTTPVRRQTQRPDVRYRTRLLASEDVTIREGLPVTTPERTIADLVEDRQDLSIVGGALRDAARRSRLNVDRLADLLGPLAERNGYRKGDGEAVLEDLLCSAGIDQESIAKQLAAIPSLGALIAEKYLESLPAIDISPVVSSIANQLTTSVSENYQKQLATISEALSRAVAPAMPDVSGLTAAIASAGAVTRARLAQQLNAIDWANLVLAAEPHVEAEESRAS